MFYLTVVTSSKILTGLVNYGTRSKVTNVTECVSPPQVRELPDLYLTVYAPRLLLPNHSMREGVKLQTITVCWEGTNPPGKCDERTTLRTINRNTPPG